MKSLTKSRLDLAPGEGAYSPVPGILNEKSYISFMTPWVIFREFNDFSTKLQVYRRLHKKKSSDLEL